MTDTPSPPGTGPSPPPGLPPGLTFWSPPALIATWFGTGLMAKAPGTWGSLAALPLAWILATRLGPWAVVAGAVVLLVLGLWAVKAYLTHSRNQDPGTIVIDEVVGQMLAVALAGLDPLAFALGFAAFRFFDILKPWPIKSIERGLKGALGVMADDIAAALYTAMILTGFFMLTGRPHVFF